MRLTERNRRGYGDEPANASRTALRSKSKQAPATFRNVKEFDRSRIRVNQSLTTTGGDQPQQESLEC